MVITAILLIASCFICTMGYLTSDHGTQQHVVATICMQLPFFLHLTNWLSNQPELKEMVNVELLGVAGHSRGAKLAALHLTSGVHPEPATAIPVFQLCINAVHAPCMSRQGQRV